MEEDEIHFHLENLGANEFLYFVHKYHQSSKRYCPYTLTRTDFSKLEKNVEYFTVSHYAVTRFAPYSQPETTSHEKWNQETQVYKKLKKLKLFATFIVWRAFRNWRKRIMTTKLDILYKTLPSKVLWYDAALGPALQTCKEICYKLKMMGLGKELKAEPLSLAQLLDDQIQNLKEIRSLFSVLRETIQDQLLASCKFAMIFEGLPTTASSTRPSSVISMGSGRSQHKPPIEAKHSLSYADLEKRISVSAKLGRFVRLVDCLLQHTLHSVLLNSFREFVCTVEKRFCTNIQGDAEKLVCLCKIEVSIEEGELVLTPSQLEMTNSLRGLFQAWEDAVNAFDLFSNDLTLTPYLREKACKTHLLDIVTSDENISNYKMRVRNILEQNFQMARGYILQYARINKAHLTNLKLNCDDISLQTDPQYFDNLLQDFKDQEQELEKIEIVRVIGIFELQMEKMKSTATPCLLSLKNFTNSLLPKISRQKVNKLSAEVQDAQAFLELLPKNTANFVEFLNYLDKTIGKLPNMHDEIEYLESLFTIMKKYNVTCMKEDITSFTVFQKSLASLQGSVTKREKQRPEIVRQFEEAMKSDMEQIASELKSVLNAANEPILLDIESDVEEVQLIIHQLHSKLSEIDRKNEYYKTQKINFNVDVGECTDLETAKRAVELRKLLWDSLEAWNAKVEDWEMQPFDTINPNELKEFIDANVSTIDKISDGLPENSVIQKYSELVENMKTKLPVIECMRNKNLKERHWKEIGSLVKQDLSSDETLTLRVLEDMNLFANLGSIKGISIRASMEAGLKEKLGQMVVKLESLEFEMKVYGESFIIADNAEFDQTVNDTCIAIGVIANSDYAAPIIESVTSIRAKFDLFTRTWEKIKAFQKLWVTMDLIFKQDEVKIKFAMEFKMFEKASHLWFFIARHIYQTASAVEALIEHGILSRIELGFALIKEVGVCLTTLIEQKRNKYSRFHFLCDEEMLAFMAKFNKPELMQDLLPKMFSSLRHFKYETDKEGQMHVLGLCSSSHEALFLEKPILVTPNIDCWMSKLDFITSKTIKMSISSAMTTPEPTDLAGFMSKYSEQVLVAVKYIKFSENVETGNIQTLYLEYKKGLESMEDLMNSSLDPAFLHKISVVIATQMHLINLLDRLKNDESFSISSFSWQKCLRLYWNQEKKHCRVKIGLTGTDYGFEFISSEDIFICSTDTEKTLINLLFSMQIGLGNYINGESAVNGKRFVLRNLANLIAVNFLHFACSNRITDRTLTRILYGAVQSGSWCCLSNTENLTASALSVLAQNIATVLQTVKAKLSLFQLEGREIKCKRGFGIIMISSTGTVSKIPKNLIKVFRPMKIDSPNEAFLVESFIKVKSCDSGLSREILAKWDAYKNTFKCQAPHIFTVGNLIRSINLKASATASDFEEVLEDKLKALTATNSEQIKLEDALCKAIQSAASRMELILTDRLLQKVVNMHQLMKHRQPVVIYGNVASGKTTVWKLFIESKRVLNSQGNGFSYDYKVICPERLAATDFMGFYDQKSKRWNSGLLESLIDGAKSTSNHVMLVLDGKLEKDWIQYLGSLFESTDQHFLLENGRKVFLHINVHLVFETSKLDMVAPSFLSRCNLLMVDESPAATVMLKAQAKLNHLALNFAPTILGELQEFYNELAKSDANDVTVQIQLILAFILENLRRREISTLTRSEVLKDIFNGTRSTIHITKSSLLAEIFEKWKKGNESENFEPDESESPRVKWASEKGFGADFQRTISLIHQLKNEVNPILIMAPTGCGKTSALRYLQTLDEADETRKMINYSTTTPIEAYNSFDFRDFVLKRSARRSMKSIGAPNGHKISFMLDDYHFASTEQSDFLRLMLDYKGLYDAENQWVHIEDVNVILTMNTDTAFKMSSRLARHFLPVHLEGPKKETLFAIFKKSSENFQTCGLSEVYKSLIEAVLSIFFSIPITKGVNSLSFLDLYTLLSSKSILSLATQETDQANLIREVFNETTRLFGTKLYVKENTESLKAEMTREFALRFGAVCAEAEKSCKIAEISTIDVCNHSQDLSTKDCLQAHFSERRKKMPENCFLFDKFAEVTADVVKALKTESRSVLLFGESGVGKRMIAKYSALLLDFECVPVSITVNTSEVENQLEKACLKALAVKKMVLILSCDDISFIQRDRNILCLIKYEKFLQEATRAMPDACDTTKSYENLTQMQLVARITDVLRDNLKIILCVTALPDDLDEFEEARYCFVQYLRKWTVNDNQEIAKSLLKIGVYESNFANANGIEVCLSQIHMLAKDSYLHVLDKKIFLATCMYFDFLHLFNATYDAKIRELRATRDKCVHSIKKLEATFQAAEELKQELAIIVPKLKEKRNFCENVTKKLISERSQVEKFRVAAKLEETALKEKTEAARILSTEIQRDLDECTPAIEASCKALELIERNELKDVKTTNKPSSLLRLLMEPVCLLLGCKSDWGSAKALAADPNFIKMAIELDKENIPEATAKKLKEYVDNPNFLPEVMESHSRFCRTLCMWVRAIHNYVKVYRNLQSKKRRLESIESEIRIVVSKLKGHQQKLADTDAKVAALEVTQDQGMAEADALSNAVEGATVKLKRASQLGSAFTEFDVWKIRLTDYNNKIDNLYGDVLLCAALVTYAGPLNEKSRNEITKSWIECCAQNNLKTSSDFCFEGIMKTASEIHGWHTNKLLKDKNLITSAVIVDKSRKIPFIVDPQEKACLWLRNIYGAQANFITAYDPNLLQEIDKALDQNFPVLIQDVNEHVPPELIELIERKRSERKIRICILTRNPTPNLMAHVYKHFNVVDFSVTSAGLENLLLDEIIHMKYPDLENQLNTTGARLRAGKRDFDDIVCEMQDKLCQFKGDLLEEEALINSLCKSKSSLDALLTARERHLKLWNGFMDRKDIFQTVATNVSDIFIALMHMHSCKKIYQFSFQTFKMKFLELLKRRFSQAETEENLKKSVEGFKKCVITELINYYAHCFCRQDMELFCHEISCSFERREIRLNQSDDGKKEVQIYLENAQTYMTQIQLRLGFDIQKDTFSVGNLKEKIMSSRKLAPIAFLLGQDVSNELKILAEELRPKEAEQGLVNIALGKGQLKKPTFWLKKAVEKGLWIHFQDCQLEFKWLQELERYFSIFKLDPNLVHENFRMFYSVNSDFGKIPPGLAQLSILFSTEDFNIESNCLVAAGAQNLHSFNELLKREQIIVGDGNFPILRTHLYLNYIKQNIARRKLRDPDDCIKYYTGNVIYRGHFNDFEHFQALLPLAFENDCI